MALCCISIFITLFFFFVSVYVHTDIITAVPWHVCGGQQNICRSQFSPSTMWVKEMKPRLSDLRETSWHTEPARISCPLFQIQSMSHNLFFFHINYKFYTTWCLTIFRMSKPFPQSPAVSCMCITLSGVWSLSPVLISALFLPPPWSSHLPSLRTCY